MSRRGDENDTEDDVTEAEDDRLQQEADEFRKAINNWEESEYE